MIYLYLIPLCMCILYGIYFAYYDKISGTPITVGDLLTFLLFSVVPIVNVIYVMFLTYAILDDFLYATLNKIMKKRIL